MQRAQDILLFVLIEFPQEPRIELRFIQRRF